MWDDGRTELPAGETFRGFKINRGEAEASPERYTSAMARADVDEHSRQADPAVERLVANMLARIQIAAKDGERQVWYAHASEERLSRDHWNAAIVSVESDDGFKASGPTNGAFEVTFRW